MNQTKLYAEEDQHNADNIKQRVEEEIMSRKKVDISDVIKKNQEVRSRQSCTETTSGRGGQVSRQIIHIVKLASTVKLTHSGNILYTF